MENQQEGGFVEVKNRNEATSLVVRDPGFGVGAWDAEDREAGARGGGWTVFVNVQVMGIDYYFVNLPRA